MATHVTGGDRTSQRGLGPLAALKPWLSIAESAQRLAAAIDDRVVQADIFQFALSRRLTLSAVFPRPVRAVLVGEIAWARLASGEWDSEFNEARFIPAFELPEDVYDLPMVGLERLAIEHEYRKRIRGPKVRAPATAGPTEGPFVKSCATGEVFWLHHFESWAELQKGISRPYETGSFLPPDTLFVVRPEALEELIQRASRRRAREESGVPAPISPHAAVTSEDATPFAFAEYDLETSVGRRAAVKTFLVSCNHSTPKDIKQRHIWKAIGYQAARQFQYWLAAEPRPKGTKACDENVRRILRTHPADFVELLKRQNLL